MIDLKQLMRERSAHPPALADLRYSQIRRRIAVRKRRRIALVAAAAAVILAIASGYAGLPRQRVLPEPVDTATATTGPGGFPPYKFGRKMVQYATAPISSGSVSLTWTPATLQFHFTEMCSGIPENVYVLGTLLVNGNPEQETSCGPRHPGQPARTEDWLRSGWIRAGEPITLTLTAEDANYQGIRESPAPMPTSGTMALAIYAPVPFEQYPLPPRPAELPPLADWTDCPLDLYVHSDARDPLKRLTATMPWHGDDLIFRWDTQTPGTLTVDIDGVKIITVNWWEYGHLNWSKYFNSTDLAGIPGWRFPAEGQEVTVTFTPENFTGQWQSGLKNEETDDDYRPCP